MTTGEKIQNILHEVGAERALQLLKWTRDHDDNHTIDEWSDLIQIQCDKLHFSDHSSDVVRETFLKIGALAVAAVESIDRKGASS